jgi:cellulose biosynthesis protein BcsQ
MAIPSPDELNAGERTKMLTISLVGQKGGGAKSTCCWILAQAALARPEVPKVLLIETDKQGSTAGFVQGAHAAWPELEARLFCEKATTGEELYDILITAEESDVGLVLVDTEGRHGDLPRDVMSMSDRIIIPVKPVMHEYRSQLATVATYEALRDSFAAENEEVPPCGLLLNNFKTAQRMTAEQALALEQITSHPMILPFFMPHRSNFETLGRGRILPMERQALTGPGQGLSRQHLDTDISEASAILAAIEGMG